MKKSVYSFFVALMILLMSLTMFTVLSSAEVYPLSDIKVSVKVGGTLPETSEKFTVKLTPVTSGAPMPADSVDGVYTFTVKGGAEEALPTVAYTKVGIYKYEIAQESGGNKKCDYDNTVYTLVVSAFNGESGSREIKYAIYSSKTDKKVSSIVFSNVYETETTASTTKTPPAPSETNAASTTQVYSYPVSNVTTTAYKPTTVSGIPVDLSTSPVKTKTSTFDVDDVDDDADNPQTGNNAPRIIIFILAAASVLAVSNILVSAKRNKSVASD